LNSELIIISAKKHLRECPQLILELDELFLESDT